MLQMTTMITGGGECVVLIRLMVRFPSFDFCQLRCGRWLHAVVVLPGENLKGRKSCHRFEILPVYGGSLLIYSDILSHTQIETSTSTYE